MFHLLSMILANNATVETNSKLNPKSLLFLLNFPAREIGQVLLQEIIGPTQFLCTCLQAFQSL